MNLGVHEYWYICRGCGLQSTYLFEPHCPTCLDEEPCIEVDLLPLAALAHNLAIAGALCASFELAIDSCSTSCEHWYGASDWRPGCGKAAP